MSGFDKEKINEDRIKNYLNYAKKNIPRWTLIGYGYVVLIIILKMN